MIKSTVSILLLSTIATASFASSTLLSNKQLLTCTLAASNPAVPMSCPDVAACVQQNACSSVPAAVFSSSTANSISSCARALATRDSVCQQQASAPKDSGDVAASNPMLNQPMPQASTQVQQVTTPSQHSTYSAQAVVPQDAPTTNTNTQTPSKAKAKTHSGIKWF